MIRASRLAALVLGVSLLLLEPIAPAVAASTVAMKPAFGPPTSWSTASATGFQSGTTVTFDFDLQTVGTATATATGSASLRFQIPATAQPGSHTVSASGDAVARSGAFLVRTDWPMFQFDIGRTGKNRYENTLNKSNVSALAFAWTSRFTTGDLAFRAVPTEWHGRIYIGSSVFDAGGCGQAICSGPLWTGQTDMPVTAATPAVTSGKVFIGGDGSNPGKLYVFDANGCGSAVCAPLWTGIVGGGIETSAAVASGRVYVTSTDGYLDVFKTSGCGALTCSPLWRGFAGQPESSGIAGPSSPAIAGSRVFVSAYDSVLAGSTVALPSGGCGSGICQPLWRADTSQGNANTEPRPVVSGGSVFVGSGDGYLYGLDAVTGARKWSFSTGGGISPAMSPAVSAGSLFAGSGNGYLWAINTSNGSLRWSADLADGGARSGLFTSPVAANGLLYLANDFRIKAYDLAGCGAATCSPVTVVGPLRDEPGSPGYDEPGSPIVVNGRVFFAMQDRGNFGFWYVETYSP